MMVGCIQLLGHSDNFICISRPKWKENGDLNAGGLNAGGLNAGGLNPGGQISFMNKSLSYLTSCTHSVKAWLDQGHREQGIGIRYTIQPQSYIETE